MKLICLKVLPLLLLQSLLLMPTSLLSAETTSEPTKPEPAEPSWFAELSSGYSAYSYHFETEDTQNALSVTFTSTQIPFNFAAMSAGQGFGFRGGFEIAVSIDEEYCSEFNGRERCRSNNRASDVSLWQAGLLALATYRSGDLSFGTGLEMSRFFIFGAEDTGYDWHNYGLRGEVSYLLPSYNVRLWVAFTYSPFIAGESEPFEFEGQLNATQIKIGVGYLFGITGKSEEGEKIDTLRRRW